MKSDQEALQLQVEIDQLRSVIDQMNASNCPAHAAIRQAANPPAQHSYCPISKCSTCTPSSPFVPDFNIPLLAPGGGNNNPAIQAKLGPLAGLIGTWVSTKTNGFNVMPLPQATAPNGFILKNFFYYEVVTFSAIQGKVTNRGGTDELDCYTLFYEQRVFFSDGVQADTLVHAENGAWLNLIAGPQGQGVLNTAPNIPSPPAPDPIPPQDPSRQIVKQISVPHGNSIIAMGHIEVIQGPPDIPDVNTLPVGLPDGVDAPYGENLPSNPNINPNIVLQDALIALNNTGVSVLCTHVLHVDSNQDGGVTNIPFIQQHANVSRFTNTVWLETLSNGQLILQYSQNISLQFPLADGKYYLFPHITANTLTKVQ